MSMESTPKRGPWGPSLAIQSAQNECDINFIVKRFTKTGQLTHIREGLMEFRDMSGIPDLHEAMTIVADANSLFQELPAEIRAACGHDASNFIAYVDDEENHDQCVEWGLLPPTPEGVKKAETPKAEGETTEAEPVAT